MTGSNPFVRVAAFVTLVLFMLAAPLYAKEDGPPKPRTGAPGEVDPDNTLRTCATCHDPEGKHANGDATSDSPGKGHMALSFSGGNTYIPGVWKRVTITITLNVATSNSVKYGFQATARLSNSDPVARAGTFGIINDPYNAYTGSMAVKCAATPTADLADRPGGSCGAGLEYIQHTHPYTKFDQVAGFSSSSYIVSFLWLPPEVTADAVVKPTVQFYATSVLGIDPYLNPAAAFSTSATLTYQAPGTSADPVYPAGTLGLEALDTPSNQILATRAVAGNPLNKTVMKRDGSRLYALTPYDAFSGLANQLLTIDPRNGALLNTFSVYGASIALAPDESRIYVAGRRPSPYTNSELYAFDAGTGASVGNLTFAGSDDRVDLAVSPDGKRIYISRFPTTGILVIDPVNLSELAPLTTAWGPIGMAVSPDSSRLYVTEQDGTLTIFSTAANAVLFHYVLNPNNAYSPDPRLIVFSPDGSLAYVLTQLSSTNVITTIDAATSMPSATFSFSRHSGSTVSSFFRISSDGANLFGGKNQEPSNPTRTSWSVNIVALTPSVVDITSAQAILDLGVRPPPMFAIEAGAGTLVSESIPNGQIDPGEAVTMSLCITNTAAIASASVTGTWLTSGIVPTPSGPQSYGVIPPAGIVCRNFTFTASALCGAATLTVSLQVQETGKAARNLTYLFPSNSSPAFFSQNFDSVVAPSLPAGWTTSTLAGSPNPWVTNANLPDSAPNRAFAANPSTSSDNILLSPTIAIPAGASSLTFRHLYNTVPNYDGGVLEIAIGAGAFQDIAAAGGSFVASGYIGTLVGGRMAWTGNSGSYVSTIVLMPPSASGQNVRLRWRMISNASVSATGWSVDSIALAPAQCPAPTITTQPANQTIAPFHTVTLNVVASGTAPFTYQWYRGTSGDTATPLSSATASSYTTPTLASTTSYWVRVSNAYGNAPSNTATVSFTPMITTQPSPKTIPQGQKVTLNVVAVGSEPLTYQWYIGTSGDTAQPIPGATVSSYTTPVLTSTTNYWVRALNVFGSDNSNTATIALTCPAFFSQNFDSVVVPALPAGWTTSTLAGTSIPWVTNASSADSMPNWAFAANPSTTSDNVLISPTIAIPVGASILMFRHYYNTDARYDGGVLEIAIGAGAFQDIVAAGGSFAAGGYNLALFGPSLSDNPLGGRMAWTGYSCCTLTTTVNLPAAAAGQNVAFRWRMTSDSYESDNLGWSIDSIFLVPAQCGMGTQRRGQVTSQ